MARVELIELRKAWGQVVAVDDLDLSIENGEFVAVLGPSGCGKSTTLFLLAGIYAPSAGEVVNEVEAKHRNVGIVFQSYALYPHMTVRRNIMFPLRFKRVPRRASGARGMSQGIALRHGGRTVRLKMLGGTQWRAVTRLGRAVPGLRLGFDPLDIHEAAPPDSAAEFQALGVYALAHAKGAAIFYFHIPIVLRALEVGVDLIAMAKAEGAEVDAWRLEREDEQAAAKLAALIEAGVDQITTDSPEALDELWRSRAP